MIQIDDVVISLDVFREKFLCNLDACKGECCIEGDAGAPVELDEWKNWKRCFLLFGTSFHPRHGR